MSDGKRQKDREMASRLKKEGNERTTGVCPVCYGRTIVDSRKTKYSHVCKDRQ